MFYPIQSIRYTWRITKMLCSISKKYMAVSMCILAGLFTYISLNNSILDALLCILLIWMSIIDIYDHIIPDILIMGVLVILVCLSPIPNFLISAGIALLLSIVKFGVEKRYHKTVIGWGDMKLMTVCLLFIPIIKMPFFFWWCGILCILTSLFLRGSYLPFAPFIGSAFLIQQL
jgi:Flp pilus assembly protein protease CpaA